MRVTRPQLPSSFILSIFAALFLFAHNSAAFAVTPSRSFQMALYVDFYDSPEKLTRADTDLPMFGEGQQQPAVRSILKYKSWQNPTLSLNPYDWTRIVAAVVDEPYTYFFNNHEDSSNPCGSQRLATITRTTQLLGAAQSALKSLSPWARFWVIFTPAEIDWMRQNQCPETQLNQPYIDVISFDDYNKSFAPSLQDKYDWLATHRATPHQQLALVPGVFSSPSDQGQYLPGYYAYADGKNQSCNLPLGASGVTGSFDGCPVWMVLGWLADNVTTPDGTTYVGELNSVGLLVYKAWRREIAIPVRRGISLELTRQQIVSSLIQQ